MVTYYSIDKEPEICAKYIAEAIKAKPIEPNLKKVVDQMAERISKKLEQLITDELLGRDWRW